MKNIMKIERPKTLLIAPLFFNYFKEIIRMAEKIGYEVDYVCDAPSNSNLSKAVARIHKGFVRAQSQRYFVSHVLPLISGKQYKYVLLVAGMTFALTPAMVKQIRKMNPGAKFVMYQWDSEKNLPYSTMIHEYFDKVYSFDRYDCEAKPLYQFLPLFYTEAYERIGRADYNEFEYDCAYIGTAHPQKLKDINSIAEAVKEKMPKQFIYHYMPSKLKYYFHKLTAVEYRNAKLSDFKWEKLSTDEIMQIISKSRCILDASQAGQTGVTIRTIECLGAKKKLITTNPDVVNYEFYRPENILIYSTNKGISIEALSVFIRSNYEQLEDSMYRKYSLSNWIRALLED